MHIQQHFALSLRRRGQLKGLRFDWETYHGFSKASLTNLTGLAGEFGFPEPENMLLEMVRLTSRVDGGCHVHHNTTAVVLFLGSEDGFEHPHYHSQIYLRRVGDSRGRWMPARPGRCILIPPGTVHDFDPGSGKMHFLSVQNPRLFNPKTGEDDFHLIQPDASPYAGVLKSGVLEALGWFVDVYPRYQPL